MELTDYLGQLGLLWLLILLRTMGFVFLAPIFSAQGVPVMLRVVLAFLLSNIVYTFYVPTAQLRLLDDSMFLASAVQELALGMLLGFIMALVFVAFQFAGQFIGYQMGFAVVNVFDPSTHTQASIIGQFLFTAAMLVFVGTGMHLELLRLWIASYELLPPGTWMIEHFDTQTMVAICTSLFTIALRISLPLIAFLILIDLALGILARVMPQLNVFFVGIPVKIVLGLLFLSLVTTELGSNVRRTRDVFINHCGEMMHELGADIPQDGELEVNRGLAGHAPDSPDS
ncbi:MAG: flagellar biosynthetic protein FliR [Planctomycetales bacterium]|nr:flagellar biosynthetic protein FliR [bacterium]UNM08670.1 MAG: flagellar biosynthetic protein FliR [Planctomycetales bacterium]